MGLGAGAALAIGTGVSAAAGLAGSYMQSQAVGDASDKANAAQERALAQSRADLEPWRLTGGAANTGSADLLGLNGPDAATAARANFQASPGYQWQLSEGLRGVDAGAAALGMRRSGATEKAEIKYASGLADKEFTDYYNRLFDLSKLGETAASGQATASQNTGTSMAQTDLSAGSATSSIYGNAAQGIGNAANSYANNRLYQERYGLGGGGGSSYASLDPRGQSIAPNTWSQQPDSYYLPGGAGYQV